MYKIFNKTYQPFNLLVGIIPARDYIIVDKLDIQLNSLEEKELIKITKTDVRKDKINTGGL